ncbi:MAG: hypothetical protein AAF434_12745 [Pseudomonadota bacterium]
MFAHIQRKCLDVLLVIILSCGFGLSAVKAADATHFGGVELGFSTFRFDQKIDQKLTFSTASFTLGSQIDRYSVIANYSLSFDSAEVSEEDFTGSADREDFDLIFSYQINPNFSAFIGYKQGETSLDWLSREDEDDGPTQKESYKQDGGFIGISGSWPIEGAGRISASLAYADLDSDNTFVSDGDGADEGEPPEFDDISGKTRGSTTGYSYSLTWTLPLRGSWLFRTKLRLNRYEQDIEFQGVKFSNIDESTTTLLVGLVNAF